MWNNEEFFNMKLFLFLKINYLRILGDSHKSPFLCWRIVFFRKSGIWHIFIVKFESSSHSNILELLYMFTKFDQNKNCFYILEFFHIFYFLG